MLAKQKKGLQRITVLFMIILFTIAFLSNVMMTVSTTNSKSSTESLNANTFSQLWSTDNGTFFNYYLNPVIKEFQPGQSYIFNVTIKSVAFAPNLTSISGVNTSILFFHDNTTYVLSNNTLFPDFTKIGQVETKYITLTFPEASKFKFGIGNIITGALYYHVQDNETFSDSRTFGYDTGFSKITNATLKGPSASNYDLFIFILIVGPIILALILYVNKKGKTNYANRPPNFQSGVNNNPQVNNINAPPNNTNQNSTQINQGIPPIQQMQYNQPQNQYNQSAPQVVIVQQTQQPQINQRPPQFISNKLLEGQDIIACKRCSTINLQSMENCYVCKNDLPKIEGYISGQKDSSSNLKGISSYLILIILLFAFELLIGPLTVYFFSLKHSTNFPYDSIAKKFVSSDPLYIIWYNFIVTISFVLSILGIILFTVIPYFIVKKALKKPGLFSLSKLYFFKRMYVLIPSVNLVYLMLLGIITTGGSNTIEYDFYIHLASIGLIVGVIALPIRFWVYFKKWGLSPYETNFFMSILAGNNPTSVVNNPTTRPTNSNTYSKETLQQLSSTEEYLEQPVATIRCPNCNNQIDKNSKFCPDCGTVIVHCNLCKSIIDSMDQKASCPHCKNYFHLNHLRETVKVTGKCPTCKESLQDHEIVVE